MKKILTGIWILLILAFLILTTNYMSNEAMLKDYDNEEYKENSLAFLGFTEPYIAPYNQGDIYYQQGDYEKALEEFQRALLLHPTYERECKIRINIALCMVVPIEIDKVKPEEVDQVIQTLEEAKQYLLDHGCAHEEDSDGHNEDAQQLKEDIDKLIDMLKQQNESGGGGDDQPEEQQNNNPSNEDDIKEQLQQLQQQGTEERKQELDYINQSDDFNFYYGPTW